MNKARKIFSARIKELRGKENQTNFARKIGIPQTTYSNFERGVREPGLEILEKISIQFGVSADWLLGLTDSRDGGGAATATNGSAAATGNARATVSTACASRDAEVARLLSLVESQQRVIENLSRPAR